MPECAQGKAPTQLDEGGPQLENGLAYPRGHGTAAKFLEGGGCRVRNRDRKCIIISDIIIIIIILIKIVIITIIIIISTIIVHFLIML